MAEGELMELSGARHEVFMERPAIQQQVWQRLDAFLGAVPAQRGQAEAAARSRSGPSGTAPQATSLRTRAQIEKPAALRLRDRVVGPDELQGLLVGEEVAADSRRCLGLGRGRCPRPRRKS